ncbi:hypothetical protein LZK73_17535 [Neorhizobium galegae]|nr:hypothetical protein LZK73_17535 [Neorhizobium galegae]
MIEIMPIAHFGGNRGWGYDGVLLYAPHVAYGPPEDFKAFVDAAHGLGLTVVLDLVLNHFGPEGNYLPLLAPAFFHPEKMTPWGAAIAYDVEPVRRYISECALYWLEEFHLDGLRFDAIDQIDDSSEKACTGRNRRAHPRRDPRTRHPSDDRGRPQRHVPASTRRGRQGAALHRRMERRPSQRRPCLRDRRDACLLQGLRQGAGEAGGAGARRRLCLSGRGLAADRQETRCFEPGPAAGRLRGFHPEPRPGGQPRRGRKADRTGRRRQGEAAARHASSVAAYSAALHGRGIWRDQSLPVLHRFPRRSRESRAGRPPQGVRGPRGPRGRDRSRPKRQKRPSMSPGSTGRSWNRRTARTGWSSPRRC